MIVEFLSTNFPWLVMGLMLGLGFAWLNKNRK